GRGRQRPRRGASPPFPNLPPRFIAPAKPALESGTLSRRGRATDRKSFRRAVGGPLRARASPAQPIPWGRYRRGPPRPSPMERRRWAPIIALRARTMEGSGYDNVLGRRLRKGQFVASIEFVTPAAHEPFETAIAPITELAERIKADARFDTIALTDRVKSDHDHDPVRVAAHVAEACGKVPLVHLSGKDRDAGRFADSLRRMRETGLENVLLVTGDKVRTSPPGTPVRYHDSVNMIAQVRSSAADVFVAAAVSPFKYREEESMNQYLKMKKKENAGAHCFITQVGWDMLKFK